MIDWVKSTVHKSAAPSVKITLPEIKWPELSKPITDGEVKLPNTHLPILPWPFDHSHPPTHLILEPLHEVRLYRNDFEWQGKVQYALTSATLGKPLKVETTSSPFDIFKPVQSFFEDRVKDVQHISEDSIQKAQDLWKSGVNWFDNREQDFKNFVDGTTKIADDLFHYFESYLNGFYSTAIFPQSAPGSTETLKVSLDVGVGLDIIGLPASLKAVGGKQISWSRKPDGTFEVSVLQEVGVEVGGGEHVGGNIWVGDNKAQLDVGASASATGKGRVVCTYTFDPNKEGDIAKMTALLGGEGVSLVGGNLATQFTVEQLNRDNMTSVEYDLGGELNGKAGLGSQISIPGFINNGAGGGVNGSVEIMPGFKWEKAPDGHILQTQLIELDLSASGFVSLGKAANINGQIAENVRLEETTDLTTGKHSVKVVMGISGDVKGNMGNKEFDEQLSKLYPGGVDTNGKAYDKLTIEYNLDEPLESIKESLIKGNLQPIIDNSSGKITGSHTTGAGFDVDPGLVISGGASVERESEETIGTFDNRK